MTILQETDRKEKTVQYYEGSLSSILSFEIVPIWLGKDVRNGALFVNGGLGGVMGYSGDIAPLQLQALFDDATELLKREDLIRRNPRQDSHDFIVLTEKGKKILINNSFNINLKGKSNASEGLKGVSPQVYQNKEESSKDITFRNPQPEWDVFICHASEDKEDFVRPLAYELNKKGLKVWYDEFTLTLGDRLLEKIDEGLRGARYGVVVLSPDFFGRDWTQNELDGLVSKEGKSKKVVLPLWHKVTKEDVMRYSPILAGRYAARTSRGLSFVVSEILKVVSGSPSTSESQDISIVSKGSTLLIQKKHEVISRLYELLKVAEGSVCGLYGLKWAPTFEDYNSDDIAKFMTQNGFLSSIQQTILGLWDNDRRAAISELKKFLVVRDKEVARSSLAEASNYLVINELYLSTEAANIAHRVVGKLKEYVVLIEFPSDRHKEFRDLEELIKQGLDELMAQLKKDISNL